MNTVEILEDDGSDTLLYDNEYANFTIDVYPESKTYKSSTSLKADVSYRTEQFEYRITSDPIKVEIRLIERMDEPPVRYCVKDGVVLESDILKERGDFLASMTDMFIDRLKKEVEWHEDWVGNPISLFILSKHPEIITTEDYRRYLRQLSERIQSAIYKIEKTLESDKTGLKVINVAEYGRTISYPREKLDAMSEEESKKYGELHSRIQERLFDEKSKEHVGISENEFSSSADILKNIDVFLDRRPDSPKKEEPNKVSFWLKFNTFIIQWIWLFVVVSIVLWLLSLIVTILQYNFAFAFFASGILASYLIFLRSKRVNP